MKWLSDFLKLRKRHDSIKFALILFICAAYFLVNGIMQIVNYTSYLNKPVEYILDAYSASATLDVGIEKIKETAGVVSASFQRDYVVTSENDAVLVMSELSSEYLSECYGIEPVGNSKKIWLNSVAFDEFIGGSESDSVRLSYVVDGKTESAEFIRWVPLDDETAYAVTIGTAVSLDNSRTVRVMFDSIDVTGTNIRQIENLGYTVSNREDILIQSYEQELLFADVKCNIIGGLLSLIGGYAFVEVYKKDSEPCTK